MKRRNRDRTLSTIEGTFVEDGPSATGMRLIAASFDHADRECGWLDFLPKTTDKVWTWREDENVVSAMLARPLHLADGTKGVILGAVATVPERRRQGLASLLVEAGCRHYRSMGASFVIMWARDYLLDLYQPLGFEAVFREHFCSIEPRPNSSPAAPEMTLAKFVDVPHRGFEEIRLALETQAAGTGMMPTKRRFEGDRWTGVMDAYPFAPSFSLLFAPDAKKPAFYAVLGHGHAAVTFMEFAGSAGQFAQALDWVSKRFQDVPVKVNLTAPHHVDRLAKVHVVEREQNMCLLYRVLGDGARVVPHATWLDRF